MTVISHGHIDHTEGLQHLSTREVLCHPDALRKQYYKEQSIGMPEEAKKKHTFITTRKPYTISKHLLFLGEIPNTQETLKDDSALAIDTGETLAIITGCGHAGIEHIITYAEQLLHKPVSTIIGGLHLLTTEALKGSKPILRNKKVYMLHCFCEQAFTELGKQGARRLKTLEKIKII